MLMIVRVHAGCQAIHHLISASFDGFEIFDKSCQSLADLVAYLSDYHQDVRTSCSRIFQKLDN
jgi:hypothetical protein